MPVIPQTVDRRFDPEGDGYDYDSAIAAGLTPADAGPNAGHWGSVRQITEEEAVDLGLPFQSYLILKGRKHPTFDKAVEAEAARGFQVIKRGERYWSVPR